MDNKGIHSVIDMIREASKKDLILVSLILLPIILGEWANFLNVFDLFKQNSCYKLAAIVVVFVFYVFKSLKAFTLLTFAAINSPVRGDAR